MYGRFSEMTWRLLLVLQASFPIEKEQVREVYIRMGFWDNKLKTKLPKAHSNFALTGPIFF